SFSASTSFVIAARSGSDAMIFRSLRRTPLSRNSLILAIASPRTKLPNSGIKLPSRRTSRVQNRFLAAIVLNRSWRATFERRDTRSAERLGRNEPDWPFATLASYQYALTLYVVKECPLVWPADVPEAKIIFVSQHFTAPHEGQAGVLESEGLVCDRCHRPSSLFVAEKRSFCAGEPGGNAGLRSCAGGPKVQRLDREV